MTEYDISEIKGTFHTAQITEEIFRDPEYIKKELIEKLIEEVRRSGCVEFTKQHDSDSNAVTYRARICVVPDEQIKLLRKTVNDNATIRN
jgi:hypothetical protein